MKKIRILEFFIVLVSIRITPIAINYANQIRGYKAYGGEYLIPLFGLLIVFVIETLIDIRNELKYEKEKCVKKMEKKVK